MDQVGEHRLWTYLDCANRTLVGSSCTPFPDTLLLLVGPIGIASPTPSESVHEACDEDQEVGEGRGAEGGTQMVEESDEGSG